MQLMQSVDGPSASRAVTNINLEAWQQKRDVFAPTQKRKKIK